MKRLFKTIILLAVIALIAFSARDIYSARVKGYPSNLRITNLDGRSMEVRLNGRTETHISCMRLSDGFKFTYPIKELGYISQTRVKLYPVASEGLSKRDRNGDNQQWISSAQSPEESGALTGIILWIKQFF